MYRGERAQRGRFREFYQADIDIIGDGKLDIVNEAEIPSIIYQHLLRPGSEALPDPGEQPEDPERLLRHAGSDGQVPATSCAPWTSWTRSAPDKVRDLLVEDCGLTAEQADEILKLHRHHAAPTPRCSAALEGYRGRNEAFDTGLDELNTVTKYLAAFGVPEDNFAVDLTIARGPGLLHRHRLRDHACWTTRRSAPSAPAAAMTIWPSITPTSSCPAWASPSA